MYTNNIYIHICTYIHIYIQVCSYVYICDINIYFTDFEHVCMHMRYIHICVHIYIHSVRLYVVVKKWNFVICHKIHGIGRYNVKWNKTGNQWQIMHAIPHLWKLKITFNLNTELRLLVAGRVSMHRWRRLAYIEEAWIMGTK